MFKVMYRLPSVQIDVLEVVIRETEYGLLQEVVARCENGIVAFNSYLKEGQKPLVLGLNDVSFDVYSNNSKLGCSLIVN